MGATGVHQRRVAAPVSYYYIENNPTTQHLDKVSKQEIFKLSTIFGSDKRVGVTRTRLYSLNEKKIGVSGKGCLLEGFENFSEEGCLYDGIFSEK